MSSGRFGMSSGRFGMCSSSRFYIVQIWLTIDSFMTIVVFALVVENGKSVKSTKIW